MYGPGTENFKFPIGPRPRKISIPWTGPDQDHQKFENLGTIWTDRSMDLTVRESLNHSVIGECANECSIQNRFKPNKLKRLFFHPAKMK